jgi:hypothetical protein
MVEKRTFERIRFGLVVLLAVVSVATPAAADGSWSWPISGDVITTYKNGSDPYASGQHRGIDIAAPIGAEIHASIGGTVTYAGHLPDGGITATVKTGDERYLVSYLHMSELAVKRGDSIATGGAIGRVGVTGKRSASEPHLHLGVRLQSSGEYIDPLPLLGPRPAGQSPAAEAPAASRPLENSAPQAKSDAQARGRAQVRTPQHEITHHRLPEHATSRSARPKIVHVPASGDGVSAQSHHAADSARESHASKSNGRVAPPPLKVSQPQAVNLATPDRTGDTQGELKDGNDASLASSGPPYRLALILLSIAGIGAIAIRRRRGGRSDFTPPLAQRTDLKPKSIEPAAEVVELRMAHRRA